MDPPGKREEEPGLETHKYLLPSEEKHYPKGVSQSTRAGEAQRNQSSTNERPSRGEHQHYDTSSIGTYSLSSRAKEINQPPADKGPSRGEHQHYDTSSIGTFSSGPSRGGQKYDPLSSDGFQAEKQSSSNRGEKKYPSGRFPPSSRAKEEPRYSPSVNGTSRVKQEEQQYYPPSGEDRSREKPRYKPSSNNGFSSSSRATEEQRYGHMSSSSKSLVSPSEGEVHSSRREGRRKYSPSETEPPTLTSSREAMNLASNREGEDARVQVTDDLLRQISSSSNQVG